MRSERSICSAGQFPFLVWVDPFAVTVAVVSFVGLWKFRWDVVLVVVGRAVAGLVYELV